MLYACLICGSSLISDPDAEPIKTGSLDYFNCTRCGEYYLTQSFHNYLLKSTELKDNIEMQSIVSYCIKRMQKTPDLPEISSYLFDSLKKKSLPSLAEQKQNFITWVAENTDPGKKMQIDFIPGQSIIGAKTREGFIFLMENLYDEGLIECVITEIQKGVNLPDVKLTFKGWEFYDQIQHGSIDSRKAFMAMQYHESKLEDVVDHHFRPAVSQTGFELYKLIDMSKPGLIDNRLRNEIRTSRFLIADLTHDNRGAYWEAGFAEGLGKHVIYTCEKKKFKEKKTHFDTNHCMTIRWDINQPEVAAQELKATIRATFPDEAILTDD